MMAKKDDTQNTALVQSGAAHEQLATEANETTDRLLIVTTATDGFRRGGRAWHGTTEVSASEFTETQLEQLFNEPKLLVQVKG